MSLREYADLVAYQPSGPPPEPEQPDLTLVLYRRILNALSGLQMALANLQIPSPTVQVSEPDFEGLVQALMGTRPEMIDYDQLAQLVRDAINIPAPVVNVDNSAMAGGLGDLKEVLDGLAFSIKGIGRMGSGGGSVSLQPGQTLQGINSPVTVTGTVTTSGAALPSTPLYGQTTVSVTNTAVQLPSHALTQGVIVQALAANVNNVVVGDSAVTTGNGFQLQAGQATSAGVANTNALYVNGTANDGVCFIGS